MDENKLFAAAVSLFSRLRTSLQTVWIMSIKCFDFSRGPKALSQTGCGKNFQTYKILDFRLVNVPRNMHVIFGF